MKAPISIGERFGIELRKLDADLSIATGLRIAGPETSREVSGLYVNIII